MRRSHIFSMRAIKVAALGLYLAACVSSLVAGQPSGGQGRNVWDGAYTADQATRGSISYSANCAECHGANLQGGEGKALRGEQFWSDWRESTVGELLTYISKNMPYAEDGSRAGTLSPGIYAEIVAHILEKNDLPAGTVELTESSSAGVLIIRKDGPGELPASTLARVVGCLAPRGADGSWRLVRATRPERAAAAGGAPETDVPLGDREYQLKFVLTPLTNFVGHRLLVTGLLLGDGGVEGLNVSSVKSVAATCN
ncbi:MAG TPA: cytochrome c [Vicinamibacterales bacterium]